MLMTVFQAAADSAKILPAGGTKAGNDIYIVMYVTLIVWLGILLYLLYIDRQLKSIKEIQER